MEQIKRMGREPSTWAGVAAIAQALAVVFPQWQQVLGIVTAAAGAAAVVKREGGGDEISKP